MENSYLYYNDYVKGYRPITSENISRLEDGTIIYEEHGNGVFHKVGVLGNLFRRLLRDFQMVGQANTEIDKASPEEVTPTPKRGYETKFCEKTWLNPPDSPSTGLCVAYDGTSLWQDAGQDTPNRYRNSFFQVSDCHSSIRLHPTDDDSYGDYIKKLSKLRAALDRYISYLVHTYKKY